MIRAVFPGSFDPFTNGHLDIVQRCANLFDEVIVGVGDNLSKKYWFSIEERVELAKQSTAGLPGVQVRPLDGLLAKWCVEHDVDVIVKGLRSAVDAGFELPQATVNRELGDIETILLATNPALAHISSTIVKEVAANGGDVSSMVSAGVKETLETKIRG
ncbi:pantetheine-phosphate adenylyltransferase [Actinomyces urinae]|uniref:pantetheine-phosphate adenylyltransferase n=1 Tax=Actinomyces urinae TaxID=1689268 RepID=UPI0009314C77|nr:pantetheine-phosphate adenylyltransferase [Actinomyces urinae]